MESVAARIRRDGVHGSRQTSWSAIWTWQHPTQEMLDGWIVADGLPLFGGAQLAIDTTLISTLHCDGPARRKQRNLSGVGRPPRKGQVGGACRRIGWSVVPHCESVGQSEIPPPRICVRECTRPEGEWGAALHHPEPREHVSAFKNTHLALQSAAF